MGEREERIREGWNYDVFLSFRGPDVKVAFLSHLYSALKRCGIYTFLDEELSRGAEIRLNLLEAIESSKILVVVLSKRYASSTWCLEELEHIMYCRRSRSEQLVLPIFYDIDPSHVRRHRGAVGEALSRHETRFPLDKVQRWRLALTEVADLSGYVWNGQRSEAKLIEDITRDILQRLDSSYLHLPSYHVGIRSRVQHILPLLSIGSDDVQVIGIGGMGGIGKTTIAKAVYNEVSHHFEGTSFLADFRKYSKNPEGKVHLKKKLLSDILKRYDITLNSIDHALKERFRRKRVLVIFDDVDDLSHFTSLGIEMSWFSRGSRIIITSRDLHLLEQLGASKIYIPEELNTGESLQLLSQYAFRTSEPPEEFLGLSKDFVEYCGGLPLAIDVLGAFLFGRSIHEWRSKLELLRGTPHDKIRAILQTSYDSLDCTHQDIFLDIACFFIGMDKDYVVYILDGCGLCPDIGLSELTGRCLIEVQDNKLMMHDLIRDMGRFIVKEKSPKNCGKRSRLWDADDVIDVLTKYSGTEKVEGLSLNAQPPDMESLDAKALSNMRELRLLQLNRVQLKGSYANFPKGLRWLCWHGFPFKFIPAEFFQRNLAVMDMHYSNLRRFWNAGEPWYLRKLKYLDLSNSFYLIETPDFSNLPNLKKLLLVNCKSLVLVHMSIGVLHGKLVFVNLNGCTELEDLPSEFYRLKSLETLNLSGCSKLKKLEDGLGEMEALTTLLADDAGIKEVPASIIQLKKLKNLSLGGSHNDYGMHSQTTCRLPVSFNGLSCLTTLRLSYCGLSDELIPEDFLSLSCLEDLDLRGNPFRNLLTDFARLPKLLILRLDNCSELRSMYSLPRSLKFLHATNCISLERTPDLSECSTLQGLFLSNCTNLIQTPGLDRLKTVRVIRIEMCMRIPVSFRERVLHGWAGRVYGGVFLPGYRVPNWISFKDNKRSVSFIVPATPNLVAKGLNLCMRYKSLWNDVMSEYSPSITVKNHTKGSVWTRKPAPHNIRLYHEQHLWQGHISNEGFLLETGDQVEVDVDFGDHVTILETGVSLVYKSNGSYPEYEAASSNTNAASTDDEGSVDENDDEQLAYSTDEAASNNYDAVSINEDFVYEIEDELSTHSQDEAAPNNSGFVSVDDVSIAEIEDEPPTHAEDEAESVETETTGEFDGVNPPADCQDIPRYQGSPQLPTGENHHRPHRKMSFGLRALLGAFGFLALIVALGKYGQPLRRFPAIREKKGGKKTEQNE